MRDDGSFLVIDIVDSPWEYNLNKMIAPFDTNNFGSRSEITGSSAIFPVILNPSSQAKATTIGYHATSEGRLYT